MSVIDGSPAQQSKTEKLRRLTRPLRPQQPPWYVQHPAPATPLAGWWWQPNGSSSPVPLAASFDAALMALGHHLTDEQKAAA